MAGQVSHVFLNLKRIIYQAIDTLKGSFYANPIQVDYTASPEEMHAFPEYYGKNIC